MGQIHNPPTAARAAETEALWDVTFHTNTTGARAGALTSDATLIHHRLLKMDFMLCTRKKESMEGKKNITVDCALFLERIKQEPDESKQWDEADTLQCVSICVIFFSITGQASKKAHADH